MNRSWAEVDLQQIVRNAQIYREHICGDQEIMAVVKADAYGHGSVQVARALDDIGVRAFAVAAIEEGVALREGGVQGEIMVLGYSPVDQAELLTRCNLTQTIVSEEHAAALAKHAPHCKVQFAIDTGMNRIGLDGDDPKACEAVVRKYKDTFQITGIFTHLCTADTDRDEDRAFALEQIRKFDAVKALLSDLDLTASSCLNSAGGLRYRADGTAYVRLGIILYGLKPDANSVLPEGIAPALTWKSIVTMVKTIHEGETVGYGRTFTAKDDMRIATIATGYADGYNRMLSNRGYVLLDGQKAPIVGRVCMDQLMVDVTGLQGISVGMEAVLLGKSGDLTLTADDMAEQIGTIGYEVVCNLSPRVKRLYR